MQTQSCGGAGPSEAGRENLLPVSPSFWLLAGNWGLPGLERPAFILTQPSLCVQVGLQTSPLHKDTSHWSGVHPTPV